MLPLVVLLILSIPVFGQAEYLGELSANPFGPNSTASPFGAGRPFSPNSITNQVRAVWQSVQQPVGDVSVRHGCATIV